MSWDVIPQESFVARSIDVGQLETDSSGMTEFLTGQGAAGLINLVREMSDAQVIEVQRVNDVEVWAGRDGSRYGI